MAEADQHHQTECGHRVKGRFDTSEGNRADSKSRVVPPDGWVERQRDADSAHGRGDLQRGGQEQPPAVVSDPGEAVGASAVMIPARRRTPASRSFGRLIA